MSKRKIDSCALYFLSEEKGSNAFCCLNDSVGGLRTHINEQRCAKCKKWKKREVK